LCKVLVFTFLDGKHEVKNILKLKEKKYSVIQKDGLNFVSLYFKIIISDKYDVNYI